MGAIAGILGMTYLMKLDTIFYTLIISRLSYYPMFFLLETIGPTQQWPDVLELPSVEICQILTLHSFKQLVENALLKVAQLTFILSYFS